LKASPIVLLLLTAFLLGPACRQESGAPPSQGGSQTDSQLTGSELIELKTTLSTTYYDVDGLSTEAIFNYIERYGPTDGEGKRGSGLTSVVWGYDWQGGPEGNDCAIRSMTIRAEMVVTLPRHVRSEQLPGPIRANWQKYAESVAEHEQTHVDIYEDGAGMLQQNMAKIGPQSSCDRLESEIKRVWTEGQNLINAQQASFHSDEYARLARQREPLSARIDQNRAEIARLQRQIDGVTRQLRDLSSEIEALASDIDDIDDQVKKINESQQSPQDKQAQLVVLLQHRNALQVRHNAAVDEHNAILAARNDAAKIRDGLITETNQLVEQFNWTR
jgi:predicted secreted Zn-dependent protease